MRARVARGALVFAVAAPLAYLTQRLFERWQGGVGDPLGVVRDAHTAFYWRSSTAVWLALVLAVVASRVRGGEGHHRWTPFASAAGFTALVLALATFYP